MTSTVSRFRDELADREAIRDCIYRYARGVDRCDEDLLRSAYWPDAIDTHMVFTGDREQLMEWIMPSLRKLALTQHIIANILICIDGDRADVESYHHSYHRYLDNGVMRDIVGAGRYVDTFEKRDDEWRILRRTVVLDWFRDYDDSGDWAVGPLGMKVEPGSRAPGDPSYALLPGLR